LCSVRGEKRNKMWGDWNTFVWESPWEPKVFQPTVGGTVVPLQWTQTAEEPAPSMYQIQYT